MAEPEKPAKKVLVYDPSRAIASFYTRQFAEENLVLDCTEDLGQFQELSQKQAYDALVIQFDHFYDALELGQGLDILMQERGQAPVALEKIIQTAKTVQEETSCPLLLDYHFHFKDDPLYAALSRTHRQDLPTMELPFSKEELVGRFSGKVGFIERAYQFPQLKESLYQLMGLAEAKIEPKKKMPVLPTLAEIMGDLAEKQKPEMPVPEKIGNQYII